MLLFDGSSGLTFLLRQLDRLFLNIIVGRAFVARPDPGRVVDGLPPIRRQGLVTLSFMDAMNGERPSGGLIVRCFTHFDELEVDHR